MKCSHFTLSYRSQSTGEEQQTTGCTGNQHKHVLQCNSLFVRVSPPSVFADTFDLRLTFVGENSGYYLAVAAGSFFIQPLGSSCGFCSSAVVSEPIPHHRPYWLVDIKVCRFPPLHFGCVKGFPPSGIEMEAELATFRLVASFHRCAGLCVQTAQSLNREGQQRFRLPALQLAQHFGLLPQEPPPTEYSLKAGLSAALSSFAARSECAWAAVPGKPDCTIK